MQKFSLKNLILGTTALSALVLGGCMSDNGAAPKDVGSASLSINLSVPDVNSSKSLHKGATIQLKKLVVT